MIDKQIVWVVEQGEKAEGGRVKAITQHRTEARVIKRDLCRDEWFDHEVDYVRITKMTVFMDWAGGLQI